MAEVVEPGKLIVRFESNGHFSAYAFDAETVAQRSGDVLPDMLAMVPGFMKPLIDGFLFGLRHGPLQKLLRDKNLPPFDKSAKDKDAEAVRCLIRAIMLTAVRQTTREDGSREYIDVLQADLAGAYNGVVERAPQHDEHVSMLQSVVSSVREHRVMTREQSDARQEIDGPHILQPAVPSEGDSAL